jgi:hypothetical protein
MQLLLLFGCLNNNYHCCTMASRLQTPTDTVMLNAQRLHVQSFVLQRQLLPSKHHPVHHMSATAALLWQQRHTTAK